MFLFSVVKPKGLKSFLVKVRVDCQQGILSVTWIAGYEWVPARIGHFGNKQYLFLKHQRPI